MSILTGPVNATATTFSVSDDSLLLRNGLPQMLQVESEKFLIRGYEAVGTHNTRWYVERGVDGSLAASHSGGMAITVVSAGGGGGGVSVTGPGGVPTVAATSIQTGIVTDQGGGAAVTGTCVISATDPGAIGAGNLWLDSSAGTDFIYPLWVRDPTNTSWFQASIGDTKGQANVGFNILDNSGNQISYGQFSTSLIAFEVDSAGGNSPRSYMQARPAAVQITHEGVGSVVLGQVSADINGLNFTGRLGFGVAPVDKPQVPATPTAQNIVDALVALGLISQAP